MSHIYAALMLIAALALCAFGFDVYTFVKIWIARRPTPHEQFREHVIRQYRDKA